MVRLPNLTIRGDKSSFMLTLFKTEAQVSPVGVFHLAIFNVERVSGSRRPVDKLAGGFLNLLQSRRRG
jgi:hypothetical protein